MLRTAEFTLAPVRLRGRLPEAALVFITMLWGGTFLVAQTALQWSGPYTLVGLRLAIAALLIGAVLRGRLAGLTRAELRAGAIIGVALFFGHTLQTVGLEHVVSSKSAFLTALYVPMVPLVQWVWLKRSPHAAAWLGIALAFAGTVLLSNPAGMDLAFGLGDALTVAGALAIAFEILLISRYAKGCDPARLAFVQTVVVAGLCLPAALLHGEGLPQPSLGLLLCLGGLAAATAFIQFAMNWAQQTVSATRATLIYAMEPVWAGVVGRLAGERLGPLGMLGAALIVLAIVVSEWRRKIRA